MATHTTAKDKTSRFVTHPVLCRVAWASCVSIPVRLILFVPLRSALSSIRALQRARFDKTRQLIVIAILVYIVCFVMDDLVECTARRRRNRPFRVTNGNKVVNSERLGNFQKNFL